jgi:hypothetical protein
MFELTSSKTLFFSWKLQIPPILLNTYVSRAGFKVVFPNDVMEEMTSLQPETWSQWDGKKSQQIC